MLPSELAISDWDWTSHNPSVIPEGPNPHPSRGTTLEKKGRKYRGLDYLEFECNVHLNNALFLRQRFRKRGRDFLRERSETTQFRPYSMVCTLIQEIHQVPQEQGEEWPELAIQSEIYVMTKGEIKRFWGIWSQPFRHSLNPWCAIVRSLLWSTTPERQRIYSLDRRIAETRYRPSIRKQGILGG